MEPIRDFHDYALYKFTFTFTLYYIYCPLKSDGQLHSDACKKAEILNDQFTSVITNDNQDKFADTVLEGPSIPSGLVLSEYLRC